MPFAMVMLFQIMDLGMAVMAGSYGVGSACVDYLFSLETAVFPARIRQARLQESAAAAATVVIGFIRSHVDEVFFPDHLFHDIAEIIGNGIAETLPHKLTGVLNGEGHLQIFIPVRAYREFSLADPFRIVLDDAGDFKVVRNIEFFQSGPD